MLLVPRQLQRSGMTGTVPYYGGRLSPAQAYAASHPTSRPELVAPKGSPAAAAHAPVPGATAVPAPPRNRKDTLDALTHLLHAGVITGAEYDQLRSRVPA